MDENSGTTPVAPEPPAAPPPPAPEPVAAPAPPASSAPAVTGALDSNTKLIAMLGWIFAPWGLIAVFLDPYKGDAWLRQHVIQAAGVAVVGYVLSTVTFGIASVVAFIYQIVMGIKAYNGESVEVPLVYGVVKGMINPS